MNDSEIEIGGTYEVLKRDDKTHRPSPITVKVTGTKDVSSTRKTTRLQYACERADNGKSVLVKSAKLFQRKVGSDGRPGQPTDSRGPPPAIDGSLQVPAAEPLRPAPGGVGEGCGHYLHPVILVGGQTCCEERESDENRRHGPDEIAEDSPDHPEGGEGEWALPDAPRFGEEGGEVAPGTGTSLAGAPGGTGMLIPPINPDLIRERGRLHFHGEWVREETDVAVFWSLWTDCGRYCLTRVDSTMGTGSDWATCAQEDGRRTLLTRDHRSLGRAVASLLTWHQMRCGLDHLPQVNEDEIEIAAKNFLPAPAKSGYDTGKQRRGISMAATEGERETDAPLEQWAAAGRAGYQMVEDFIYNQEEKAMQVQEKVVTTLFGKIGLEKTPPEKWVKRLSNLGQYVAEDAELTASEKKLVASLEEAVKAGAKIEVVSGKANGEAKAKPKKEPKTAKETVRSESGANNELVRKALGKRPLSFKEICDKTGLRRGQVRYSFLDQLVKDKIVVKTNDGWALKS